MTVAKRSAIDAIRHDKMPERKHEKIARELDGEFDHGAKAPRRGSSSGKMCGGEPVAAALFDGSLEM